MFRIEKDKFPEKKFFNFSKKLWASKDDLFEKFQIINFHWNDKKFQKWALSQLKTCSSPCNPNSPP